jgi:hypothetical protein
MASTIHVWVRKDDDGFEHLTFLNSTMTEVAESIKDKKIIAMIDESLTVECEITYEQPSRPYNRSVWWWRPKAVADPAIKNVDEFLASFDTLGEE